MKHNKFITIALLIILIAVIYVKALAFPILPGSGGMLRDTAWWINETENYIYDSNGYLSINISAFPSANASGDITAVYTNGEWLNGGGDAGDIYITFNNAKLIADYYNITQVDDLIASVGNSSWNESYADTLYITKLNEENLNVNSSNYWDNLNTPIDISTGDLTNDNTYLIPENLTTTYYNASTIQVVTGTGTGDLEYIQVYDGIAYNVTEVASDYEMIVNFTGISEFTTLIIRHKTDVDTGHTSTIQIWDYENSRWEGYGYLPEETTSQIKTLGVYDDGDHIQDGVVQVRFYQDEKAAPPTTHIHQFDWVILSKGFGTPVGAELDPLSVHRNGNTPLTGNWDAGNYNITANQFNGDWNGSLAYYTITQIDTIINNLNNLSLSDIELNIGNWSNDKINYYVKSEIYNKTESDDRYWNEDGDAGLTGDYTGSYTMNTSGDTIELWVYSSTAAGTTFKCCSN